MKDNFLSGVMLQYKFIGEYNKYQITISHRYAMILYTFSQSDFFPRN